MEHIALAEQHRRTQRLMDDTMRRRIESARTERARRPRPEPEAEPPPRRPERGLELPRF